MRSRRRTRKARGQNCGTAGSDPIAPQSRGPIPSGFGGHSRPLAASKRSSCFGRDRSKKGNNVVVGHATQFY